MQTNEIKIKETEQLIQDINKWLDKSATTMKEIRENRKAARNKLEELEKSCEDQNCKIVKFGQDENFLLKEKIQKERSLAQAQQDLKDLIHQDKLNDLISKQPTFAEALENQIEVFAKNRLEGLSFGDQETDTKKIAEGILKRINALGDFSQNTYVWRDACGHYKEKIKEICDAKLKGENITSDFAQSRFLKIQNVLRQQETSLFR